VNHYQTINGYWMEQSGGRVGISSVTAFGPYRMPKNSSQYGLNDIGQERQQGCPGQTTVTGNQADVTTIAVESTKFLKVGDVITIAGVSPSGQRVVTAIPDDNHLTLDATVTVTDKAGINNCAGTTGSSMTRCSTQERTRARRTSTSTPRTACTSTS
jgi:M6 family metalloprotease-like protein